VVLHEEHSLVVSGLGQKMTEAYDEIREVPLTTGFAVRISPGMECAVGSGTHCISTSIFDDGE